MKRVITGLMSLVLLVCTSFRTTLAAAEEQSVSSLSCVVKKVLDGDSVICLTDEGEEIMVRLDRIDAPEKGQPYADRARAYLREMILGKRIELVQHGQDSYQRDVGIIFCDGVEVNLKILQEGYAWHYNYYDKTPSYIKAEQHARKNRLGLWQDPHPVNPYTFRKLQSKNQN